MKRRIVIIEDEPIIAESARLMVTELSAYEVTHIFYRPQRAMDWIAENDVDLVLLDIDLGSQLSGIDVARFLSKKSVPFIFMTSYSDKATLSKALVHNPFGYVVKPVNRANLFAALELAFSRIYEADHVSITDGKTLYKFKSTELIYLVAEGNYTEIFTTRNKCVLRKSLKSIEGELPELFIRTHRNYIVNTQFIEKVNAEIILNNGVCIPVSRTYREALSKVNKF